MLAAIIWGLIQGLTEFLPISSSGHLVIVPAIMEALGYETTPPSLGETAVLHLGTLVAVLIYFRDDVKSVLRMRTEPEGRKIATLVVIGSLPIAVGLPLRHQLETLQDSVTFVGFALIVTGVILIVGQRLATGTRNILDGRIPDAVIVGISQAIALIPGISRSGTTITTGNARGFQPTEAARFSFLLGIPAIAAAGLVSLPAAFDNGGLGPEILVATIVAGISGYFAIALLLTMLRRIGLVPFAIYCFVMGAVAITLL